MKEGIHPLEKVNPDAVKEPGFKAGKFFVVHSHIGSEFDHKITEANNGGLLNGLEGSPGNLRVRGIGELLDSSKHEIVVTESGLPEGGNQAQNMLCELLE